MAGDDYPAELVKAKFLKLDSHHIEFVMDCLRDNTTKVRNIKQYLRAMLFNAPSTINSYYASLVAVSYTHLNNDFAGIKNWFNEFYARDTSRKIRAVQKAKGERGVPLLSLIHI